MSVQRWLQSASKLDAYYEADIFAGIIRHQILRDFGLKRKPFTALVDRKTREEHPELAKTIQKIDTYQNDVEKLKLLMEYPDYLIENYRSRLLEYSDKMLKWIVKANSILPQIEKEHINRIEAVDMAIGYHAAIAQKLEAIEEDFHIDMKRYENCFIQCKKVEVYLHRWKQFFVRDYNEFLNPALKEERLKKESDRKRKRKRK